MRPMQTMRALLFATALCASGLAWAQHAPDATAAAAMSSQKQAMARLSFMDGTWRGQARSIDARGEHVVTHTERVGTLLDGTIRLIEGHSYNADGNTVFNAFAVLSWDAAANRYAFRSHAMGRSGEFEFTPTADGYTWRIPAGPATLVYTATFRDGTWHEVGERIQDGDPVRIFEMTLRRLGDSTWPSGGAVPKD